MTAAQSLYRKFGALELPLAESRQTDLAHLDPARDILLDLFAAALNSELEPVWRWPAAFTALSGSTPVQQKLPSLPEADVLAQVKTGWPLLSVGREEFPRREDYLLYQDKLLCRWDVSYILAPLTADNQMKIRDVLQAVVKIVTMVIREGGHRAYRTETVNGVPRASVVLYDGDECCKFLSLELTEAELGPAQFVKDGPKYHAASMTLQSVERSDYSDAGDGESVPLMGADYQYGVGGAPQGLIPGLVAANTDPVLQKS